MGVAPSAKQTPAVSASAAASEKEKRANLFILEAVPSRAKKRPHNVPAAAFAFLRRTRGERIVLKRERYLRFRTVVLPDVHMLARHRILFDFGRGGTLLVVRKRAVRRRYVTLCSSDSEHALQRYVGEIAMLADDRVVVAFFC